MYNRLSNTRQGRPWQMLLLVFFTWFLPQQAAATHVDDTWKYQVSLNGSNTISIQAPVYDQEGADCWVCDGNLKATWTDDNGKSQTKTVFHWQRNGDTDSSSKDIWIHFRTDVGGSIDVTQGNTSNHFTLTSADGDIQRLVYRNNDGNTYTVYAVWRLPYDMLGKDGKSRSVKFTWDVQRDGNGRSKEKVSGLSDVTISVPAAQGVVNPQVTMASMAYSEVGKLEVPWFIASTSLTAARYEYINANGQKVQQQLPTNANSGTIYLDATEPHNSFRVVVSYKDNSNYSIDNVSSETQNLKMIHAPVNFSATPSGDRKASVRLSWSIQHPSTDDLSEMDFFEIQRSLTGEEADFVTIGSEPFMLSSEELNYTYIDSTLIDAVTEAQLTGGGTLSKLTYRVRRMITQNWGWDGNNCAQQATCTISNLHLLHILNSSARWEDEKAYTVRVSWDYDDGPNAVWDNRADMKMRIVMRNRDGAVVDSTLYTLTADERQQRYKVVSLSRPCVDYEVVVYVDRGTSPLPSWDVPMAAIDYFPIRSKADWNTFRQKVTDAKGQYDVSARLYADISTTASCGDKDYPFRGHFDGNGHTLTFSTSTGNSFEAPFKVAKDYTIEDLTVNGVIKGGQHSAGLVGDSYSSEGRHNIIRNVRVSSTVESVKPYMGGIVGHGNRAGHIIVNCLFDGTLKSTGSNAYGGAIIGWCDDNSENYVSNCFENGTYEGITNIGLYFLSIGGGNGSAYSNDKNQNNWSANQMNLFGFTSTIIINSEADWELFRQEVQAAKGQRSVDAIMNIDISVTSMVGDQDFPYCGTFNGNGHTLTVNIDGGTGSMVAPFRWVGKSTFKNLRVNGDVKGGIHSAGLIGGTNNSPVRIENLYSSVRVSTSDSYVGGIIGHAHKSNVYIEDCKSFGSLFANGSNAYGGAVIGWSNPGGTWEMHRVYEWVDFYEVVNKAFCYDYDGSSAHAWGYNDLSTTCVSYHNFSEVKPEYRNISSKQAVSIFNNEQPGSWTNSPYEPVMEVISVSEEASLIFSDALLANLGSGWKKDGADVVPITLPTFHHESIGKVEKTLVTQTRQSSVVITWDTDGNPVDYFQVLRRVKGSSNWEVIADQLDHTSYEDKTVSPLSDYEYMVRGANDCEGMSYSETDIAQGACKHTGRVSGYVRLKDGTGVPGIDVTVTPPSGTATTVKTDETGYFVADELSYFGKTSVTYTVTPVSSSAIQLEVESYAVTFDNRSNDETLHEFIITNSHRFTGYVMYDGTSIPVKGARFRVNGQPLHNNKGGYVETDFDGSFSFNVLDGKNVIQAVMDGHTFTADGYFKGKDGHVFTDDVAQIYFYDDTKVKLTGRVVGGNDQGRLPLENNLSRNNLGDDLTMVFTLEGDNTSWLVYDNQNPERTERDTTFMHTGGQHSTQVQTQRKRMVVKPDAVTGEYVLMLPPVRWKVQQVYCKGYPTLFQDGMVSEVVDLTDCRDTVYSRIYHAPVEITYRQANYETFDYFGDKTYTASTVGGDKVTVPLVCEGDASNTAAYTFGYPVFSLGRNYPIELQVGERYLYNNDTRTGQVDIVSVGGGQVTVRNGMRSGLQQEVVTLDSLGQGRYYLLADQTTRLLTGEDALKTVTMTLTQDGTTYEAKPLQGYVLNMFATSGAKDVISAGEPVLIDVLRDPPGGSSTATLSKGSKLKLSYTVDMKFKAGLDITFGTGTSLNNYSGLVAGTAEYGLINSATTTNYIDLAVIFSGAGKKAYSYTMTVGEDITTSGAATMVGAEADLYIGVVQNMVVTPVSTIRAIPDSLYQHMVNRLSGDVLPTGNTVKYGTLVEIAKGQDTEGNIYHLVRDESLAYGPQLESQFIHSQKHIVSEILPKLANEINALLFTGTLAEAQAQANQTGQPVYLVTKTAEGSGLVEDYQQVLPAGSQQFTDEVAQKLKIMKAWVDMIAMNEREKLNAHDLVANYDVDGGTKVSYSEAFETEYSVSQYINYPFTQADYFGTDGMNADDVTALVANVLLSQPALASLFKLLSKAISPGGTSAGDAQQGKLGNESLELSFAGTKFNFGIKPVVEYSSTGTYGSQHNYSRKESFNLSMDTKSHLSVDVYRAHTLTTDDQSGDTGNFDVFRNDNFDDWVDAVNNHIDDGVDYSQVIYPHNFVYRTRGGATHAPWEDARYTVAYQPGTPLDERTKKICNPVITLDRQSVSGVAMGEPARFKMYITNESEWPEAATGGLTMYTLFMDGEHNPNGAKLSVDGSPLNGNGMSIVLYPGKVLEKTLEVYAGSEFDYEGLVVGVASSSDWINTQCKVAFDVHYLHEAGPVLIASPGDKWVMNTNAQYDAERGWFLPVTIEGFDKHQPNFDHIEFQYKESLRGEDAWTNLCSYYADSLLMAEASGVKEMIPENGNITNRFYGEGTVMEKAYDLRAVLYCRNGNAFLTTASPIVSGVKDTRRPQLFGTPEPINGILTMGQNILFNFSEDIEYNYLNAITNFEVKGEVNNQNVTETVSLQFSGNSSVESEAQRNFSGKDLTIDLMIRPDETGRDMPLFSHGTNGKRLQLWLTSDYRLKAIIDDQEFISDSTIVKGGFTQVALVIDHSTLNIDHSPADDNNGQSSMVNGQLTFYNGGKNIGTFALTEPYNGTGPLIFGRTNEADRTGSTFYEGRMMEARLWYRAMTGGQIGTTYGSKRLTGYEMGLVDYYPMNEGTGDYAIDKTQGANARLINAAWAMPRGLSLHVDWDDKGIALTQNALNRTSEQDYTLMFWFKTDAEGRGVLLSNGAGSKTEINAANLFNIAFEAEKLMYRSNGHAYDLGSTYSDNQWHHLAMTVNRSYNVANIYVDEALRATFSPDSLGGISGGHPMIGGAQYDELDADGHVATIDTRNWLRGNVDELMFFSQALPLQLIKTYATKSPQGDEAGLLTYLSFDRQERQKDNDIMLVAYPYSKKIYLDDNGNPRYEQDPVTMEPTTTPVRDYVFADSVGEILKHITDETAAPVVPYEELKNLTFSFVGKDNQLLVNINEPDARINRRNIYVTVRDVEDKNGNAMASPHTACYYVTNSALSWLGNREAITVWYGQDNTDISLVICNNGATSHTYTIENCPKWLTLSTYTDVITPQEYVTITARVNKDLNVGTYDEILYLTDEDGVSEPFYLNLTVEGEQPDWSWNVSSDLLQYSMNIVGRVFINDEIDIDNRDIVGAFGQDGQCNGFAHVSYSTLTGESNLYLTVYDNQANGRDLYFKLWQYATGRELQLSANGGSTLTFQNNTVVGTDTPVRFTGGDLYVQTFDLKEGWNWVSFNVSSERLFNLNTLLDGLPWKEGDVLTDMNSDVTLVYTGGHWLASENPRNIVLSPRKAYAIKVQEDIKFPVAGSIIKADDTRTIDLKKGWNGIGYTPMLNLPIETALSDYYDKAEPGDVIKSHNEFAYFTVSGGVGRWRGSLEYMKPGEGYMLLRKGASPTSFRYPFYEPGSTFIDEQSYSGTTRSAAPARAKTTMSVSAIVEGFEPEDGDRLIAYANGEELGSTIVNSQLSIVNYLSIAGDKQQGIWFAIERDGDIIAATSEQMTFTANAVIGSPDEPTVIRFIRDDNENGRWYTSSGIRLPGRPAFKGVYIFNGKKMVIK